MIDDTLRLIELTQGRVAIVDAADYEWVNQWSWQYQNRKDGKQGYATRGEKGRTTLMHVELMKHHRLWVPDREVDHRNCCRLDCRSLNMRVATHAESQHNQRKQRNNKTGDTGVSWHEPSQLWRPRMKFNGRDIPLPYFDNYNEARACRVAAEIKYFGEFRYDKWNVCPGVLTFCPDCGKRFSEWFARWWVVDWEALAN
jgi:hypothetical protein